MESVSETSGSRPCWFVGAVYYKTEDQSPRFIKEGIWENGYEDRHLDMVRSIRVGDRIAIKSTYTRKRDLPFDNKGHSVAVMLIKATGVVTENVGDGRHLRVSWQPCDPPREWYFYQGRGTIWKVGPGDWRAEALIAFAFDDKPQDLDRFRNAPYWRGRFGTSATEEQRFQWTRFYEAVADGLLTFRHDRARLVAGIHAIAEGVDGLSNLQDQYSDGTMGPLRDICPFTAFGVFNRGITDNNRKAIAGQLATFLGVKEPVPATFEGIPILNNQRSWFFGFENVRDAGDIDALWEMFAAALRFASSDATNDRQAFATAFDDVTSRKGVAWNLTCALYWSRPWVFLTLDRNSRQYLEKKLAIPIQHGGNKNLPTATEYLGLIESLEVRFDEETFPVHSFPEFSLAAWQYTDAEPDKDADTEDDAAVVDQPVPTAGTATRPYSVHDIIEDGCFLDRGEVERLLARLRAKKNLILQGPPGTGKTWLAKRLAFALMGERHEARIRVLQFHPNMSYEDFVRGWRPTGDGKLELVDGPLMEIIRAAAKEPSAKFAVVIEEINRGNPAQIFGEMLTLIEADKRSPDEAIELCHRRDKAERVFIPANVYVIGTMNIADRSLALVDFALRRRFAFADLEPRLGMAWRKWVTGRCGVDPAFLGEIEGRIRALNDKIAADPSLGESFRIGHSYVTPPIGTDVTDPKEWFLQVVDTEIGPLLKEYWFDAADKASGAVKGLTAGL